MKHINLKNVKLPPIVEAIPDSIPMDNVNLFIGTPAYNSMIHTDYLHSIIDFYKNGFQITVMTIGNESLIPRGRNTIISYFHNMRDFSHLLFLDSDIYLEFKAFSKLMSHNKDVIAAPVALKGFDESGRSVYNVGKVIKEVSNDLCTVDKVGTAVFILSRKAVNALIEDAIKNNNTYHSNKLSRGDTSSFDHYDVFNTGVVDNEYDSEDFSVCRKLISLGFDIHVDPTVRVRHNGMFVFV